MHASDLPGDSDPWLLQGCAGPGAPPWASSFLWAIAGSVPHGTRSASRGRRSGASTQVWRGAPPCSMIHPKSHSRCPARGSSPRLPNMRTHGPGAQPCLPAAPTLRQAGGGEVLGGAGPGQESGPSWGEGARCPGSGVQRPREGSVLSDPWRERVALMPWACWELWAGKDVCPVLSVVQQWAASGPLRWAHAAGWAGGLDGQRPVRLQGPEAGAADLWTRGSARGWLRARSAQ